MCWFTSIVNALKIKTCMRCHLMWFYAVSVQVQILHLFLHWPGICLFWPVMFIYKLAWYLSANVSKIFISIFSFVAVLNTTFSSDQFFPSPFQMREEDLAAEEAVVRSMARRKFALSGDQVSYRPLLYHTGHRADHWTPPSPGAGICQPTASCFSLCNRPWPTLRQ